MVGVGINGWVPRAKDYLNHSITLLNLLTEVHYVR